MLTGTVLRGSVAVNDTIEVVDLNRCELVSRLWVPLTIDGVGVAV